jgi:hypothetical protein
VPIAETATAIVLSPAIGGKGYQHCGQLVIEYSATSTITLTGIAADEGNNSYGTLPITLPATGGQPSKLFLRPSANKFKWVWFQFSFDASASVFIEGATAYLKSWGSSGSYEPIQMFASTGGLG